jgi:chemotaxis protein CheD
MIIPRTSLPRVEVMPGERHAAASPVEIKTLLGSCIAACLYDATAGVAGLNHFLLASPRYARSLPFIATDAGRYGIHAMELLINDMMRLGATRAGLRAKVFGGASVLDFNCHDNFLCVAEVNQRFIRDYLAVENIPLVSEDLGGQLGRVIHFRSDDFRVFRRFIQKRGTVAIEAEEQAYWQRSVESRKPSEGEAVLF